MYVAPLARGRGVARLILERLEAAAREMGVERLVLESGVHQGAAIALYERSGYERVPCFGEYATSPTSICYSKRLPAAG
ncbi:MAG TPA: GNAT family N-acetyltransferase [Candidatus Dormibacteraeota bacterium]|jgi:ribosomal protein S18 acetylase RimI-like enzyme|nr:GNAT family N-acetyltransferase [Candidatus Dormibacteraeota bacterium]